MLNRVAVRVNRTITEMGKSLVLGARRPASTGHFHLTCIDGRITMNATVQPLHAAVAPSSDA